MEPCARLDPAAVLGKGETLAGVSSLIADSLNVADALKGDVSRGAAACVGSTTGATCDVEAEVQRGVDATFEFARLRVGGVFEGSLFLADFAIAVAADGEPSTTVEGVAVGAGALEAPV